MAAKNEPESILDLILKADGKELAIIDHKINLLKDSAETIEAEIAKLKSLRKTIDVLINGKAPRKKREAKAKEPKPAAAAPSGLDVLARRKQIALLLVAQGAMKPAAIAEALGASAGNVGYWLSSGHFTKDDKGYHLTPYGRNELLD